MQNKFLLHSFIFIVLSGFIVACGRQYSGKTSPQAINGVINLSNWNFEKDGPVELKGQWEFYWEQLLEPKDFEKDFLPIKSGYFNIPKKWNGHKLGVKELPAHGYATFRLKMINLDSNRKLSIFLPYQDFSYRAWADKDLLASIGKVGRSKEESEPEEKQTIAVLGQNNVSNLTVQIANFFHRLGGFVNSIEIGTYDQIQTNYDNDLAITLFLTGSFVIMGFYHLGLYALRKEDPTTLFFGLICLFFSIKLFAHNTLFSKFFLMNWSFELNISYLTQNIVLPLVTLFLRGFFPKEISRYFIQFSIGVCGVLCMVIVATSPSIFSYTQKVWEFVLVVTMLYWAYGLTCALIKKRDGVKVIAFGFMVLITGGTLDILSYNKIINLSGAVMSSYSLFLFLFVQSYVLSKRFSDAFQKISELSVIMEESEKRLQLLTDAAFDGVAVIRKFGNILTVNDSFENLFKYEQNKLVGKSLLQLIDNESSQKLADFNQDVHLMEIIGERQNGDFFPAEIIATKHRVDGEDVWVVGVNDTTQKKENEKTRINAARLSAEMETAQIVQEFLLPAQDPELEEIELASFYQSASETGGDWYRYTYQPENQTLDVLIGDVTGHGVPAAIITGIVDSSYDTINEQHRRNEILQRRESDTLLPSYFMEILNRLLHKTTQGKFSLTLFYSIIDFKKMEMIYAGASHRHCYLWRPGEPINHLKIRSSAIGQTENTEYKCEILPLKKDDVILWYTDGLTENKNENGQMFGYRSIKYILEHSPGYSAQEIKDRIVNEALNHYGDHPREDDITFIVGKMK